MNTETTSVWNHVYTTPPEGHERLIVTARDVSSDEEPPPSGALILCDAEGANPQWMEFVLEGGERVPMYPDWTYCYRPPMQGATA